MKDLRIAAHPLLGNVQRGKQITVQIDGRLVKAFEGETIAALLFAEGIRTFRRTSKLGKSRGLFCGMGVCYDCLVTVDSTPNVRACVTLLTEGMVIETGSEVKR